MNDIEDLSKRLESLESEFKDVEQLLKDNLMFASARQAENIAFSIRILQSNVEVIMEKKQARRQVAPNKKP